MAQTRYKDGHSVDETQYMVINKHQNTENTTKHENVLLLTEDTALLKEW